MPELNEDSTSQAVDTNEVETVEKVVEEVKPEENELAVATRKFDATNKRLLAEKIEFQNKYKELRDKNAANEMAKLESNENKEALIEKLKADLAEANSNVNSLKEVNFSEHLTNEVHRLAPDAFRASDVVNELNYSEFSVDDVTGKITNLKDLIDNMRVSQSDRFNEKRNSGQISGSPRPPKKQLGYEEALSKCTTQAQLDALRMKHGRA